MACYKLMLYSGTIVFVFTAVFFFLLDEFMLGTFNKKTEAQDFVALCVTSAFETAHIQQKNHFITIYVYH